MRKTIIKISIAIISLVLSIIIAFACVISIRGNTDNVSLPNEFEESLNTQYSERKNPSYARIMSANLLVHYESWGGTDAKPRSKMFFSMLEKYSPDVVALQEMSDQWYSCIMKNKGKYKLVYPLETGLLVRMTALIYNSDTVNLLDFGQLQFEQGDNPRLRRVVWGLFEDIATKKQYVVTSTHFDLIRENQENSQLDIMNSQAQEQIQLSSNLKKRFNCPVFSCGDFNAMDSGGYGNIMNAPSVYNTLCKTFTDTKSIALEKNQGNSLDVDEPTYDHILMLGNEKIQQYTILSDKIMENMSDHFPIFADIE